MTPLPDCQEIERPFRATPLESLATAENLTVSPTTRVAVAGDTVTDATATGAEEATVRAAEPIFPSLVAEILTLPGATAVTRPAFETVAIAVFAEVQLMTRLVSTAPFASRVTAESCADAPTCRLIASGETVTEDTGTGAGALTLTEADAVFPSLVAVIAAVPGERAETSPLLDTDAIPGLPVCQVTTRPVREFPLESNTETGACAVCPTVIVAGLTATTRLAIGVGTGGRTVIPALPKMPSLALLIVASPARSP